MSVIINLIDREKAAILLWCELMEWCKNNRVHPSTQGSLFSICGKIRDIDPHSDAATENKRIAELEAQLSRETDNDKRFALATRIWELS